MDKKIEDADSEESYISDYFQACYKDAFMEGAKWAFLKVMMLIYNLKNPFFGIRNLGDIQLVVD